MKESLDGIEVTRSVWAMKFGQFGVSMLAFLKLVDWDHDFFLLSRIRVHTSYEWRITISETFCNIDRLSHGISFRLAGQATLSMSLKSPILV